MFSQLLHVPGSDRGEDLAAAAAGEAVLLSCPGHNNVMRDNTLYDTE